MKILMIALFMSFTSFAAEEFFLKATSQTSFHSYDMEFEVNPNLGRAWVKITTFDSDPDWDDVEESIQIPGLRLEGDEVLFEKEGKVVVCAVKEIAGRWIFRTEVLRETGNCVFEEEEKIVTIDDGFYVREVRKNILKLVIL